LEDEIKYYNPNTNINDYIQVKKIEEYEEKYEEKYDKTFRNIRNDKFNDKYYINILDIDKFDINNFGIYDLKITQSKLNKLLINIQDKIIELEFCNICYSNDSNCILIPCGHKCCCYECSKNINKKCPICRNEIDNVYKIF
jgi:hypothetical protein